MKKAASNAVTSQVVGTHVTEEKQIWAGWNVIYQLAVRVVCYNLDEEKYKTDQKKAYIRSSSTRSSQYRLLTDYSDPGSRTSLPPNTHPQPPAAPSV